MTTETPSEQIARLTAERNEARDIARDLHSTIGWARGQFGAIALADSAEHLEGVRDAAMDGYNRMENLISNRSYRDALWEPDDVTGDYKPRTT